MSDARSRVATINAARSARAINFSKCKSSTACSTSRPRGHGAGEGHGVRDDPFRLARLGYQVCDDALRLARRAGEIRHQSARSPVGLRTDRQPRRARLHRRNAAAANFAWCNRQLLMWQARECFETVFGRSWQELGMNLVYDVAHNIAKFEEHAIGARRSACGSIARERRALFRPATPKRPPPIARLASR